jgi:uncharacterized protein (UPF0332 family)
MVAANDAFRAAVALVELALYRDAVSRLYYAVFHAARAALICHGLQAKTHSGQLNRFAVTFGPAPVVARLLELRIDADYRSDELPANEATVRDLIQGAAAFVERCRDIVDARIAVGVDEPDPPADR